MLLTDPFNGFTAWPKSKALKTTDLLPEALQSLSRVYNATNYSTVADLNGDGLADLLYHDTTKRPDGPVANIDLKTRMREIWR